MIVVAIHGYPLDSRLYAPLMALAREGRMGPGNTVFAPDLRGRGTSRYPAQSVHTMALFADDLARDIETLPAEERFILFGLSMGGYVALEFVSRHREKFGGRMAGLCLSGSRATSDDENGKNGRELAAQAIERDGMDAALSSMLPRLLPPSRRGTPIEAVTRQMILDTPPATASADQRGMALRRDHFSTIASTTLPILLIAGEADPIVPISEFEAIAETAARAPYVRLLTLPGVGHLAPLESPGAVAEALLELIFKAA